MTALLVDAGNTRVKWGFWSGDSLHDVGVTSTETFRAGTASLPAHDFERMLASNVAGGAVATKLSEWAGDSLQPEFVETATELGGVVNAYDEPGRLGVDRWVALLGARAEFAGACLVVDAGTAVTLDVLASDGRHLGGQILPGAPLMMSSLGAGTSDLPDLASEPGNAPLPDRLLAMETASAIRHGAWTAVVGAIEHVYRRLQDSDDAVRLVLTGGDAPRMLDAIAAPVDHRPDLVLQGLAFILESAA